MDDAQVATKADLDAVKRSPTPVLSTRSVVKDVAPETDAIACVPNEGPNPLISRLVRGDVVPIPSVPLLCIKRDDVNPASPPGDL